MGLLRRDPAQRLTGAAVRRALMPGAGESPPGSVMATPDLPFVGRGPELHALIEARDEVLAGRARAVAIYGPSGIGKSALVRQFVRQLERDAVVLIGRCYENESVPYKALDGVVDDLSRYLASSARGLGRGSAAARCARAGSSVPRPASGGGDRRGRARRRSRSRRSLSHQAAGVRGAERAARDAGRADLARDLDRRPAMGRRRQHRPPRGAAGAGRTFRDADAVVLSQEEIGSKPFLQALLPRTSAVTARAAHR